MLLRTSRSARARWRVESASIMSIKWLSLSVREFAVELPQDCGQSGDKHHPSRRLWHRRRTVPGATARAKFLLAVRNRRPTFNCRSALFRQRCTKADGKSWRRDCDRVSAAERAIRIHRARRFETGHHWAIHQGRFKRNWRRWHCTTRAILRLL